jgi:hypothetical protein
LERTGNWHTEQRQRVTASWIFLMRVMVVT